MSDKPKIIVDEDWKSQVEAERAAAANPTTQAATGEPDMEAGEMPPATLSSLVITLATQALAGLGMLAGPDGQPLPADPEQARYLIDTLGMLEQKTAGNRTPDESQLFTEALHQLRMAYVAVTKGDGVSPMPRG